MDYVENPIVEGKDFESTAKDMNGNFEYISKYLKYLLEYQKPWDIDENVSSICYAAHRGIDRTFTGAGKQYRGSVSYLTINSGTIILQFHAAYHKDYTADPTITISINDEIVRTIIATEMRAYDFDGYTAASGRIISTTLTVNKGDVITITISGTAVYSSKNDYARVSATTVTMHANIDTPYKYFSLLEVENPVTTTTTQEA